MDRNERGYRGDDRYRDDWRYRGEGRGRGERDYNRERDWVRERGDRGFFERAGDEVRSWFGDDEAQRRRMVDDREYDRERSSWDWRGRPERHGDEWRWGGYGAGGYDMDEVDRDWARQWGYVERGERGPSSRGWPDQPRYGSPSWTARGGYGRESFGGQGYGAQGGAQYGPGSPFMNARGYGYGGQIWSPAYDSESYGYGGMSRSEWTAGPHVGRGPRGYQRSDDRIKEDVCERMSQHGQLDASDIEVRVSNAEVTLIGSVGSRQAKRMAEDIADGVSGVREVHNQIRVNQGGQEGQSGRPQGWQEGERYRAA